MGGILNGFYVFIGLLSEVVILSLVYRAGHVAGEMDGTLEQRSKAEGLRNAITKLVHDCDILRRSRDDWRRIAESFQREAKVIGEDAAISAVRMRSSSTAATERAAALAMASASSFGPIDLGVNSQRRSTDVQPVPATVAVEQAKHVIPPEMHVALDDKGSDNESNGE
jgi:hypothetical protein